MIIALSAYENNINSQVDPRFGRASYFLFFDENNNLIDTVDNTASGAMAQGAGINAATLIAQKGANVLITGSVGPKALAVLEKAGIKIIEGMGDMNIIDALNKFKNNLVNQPLPPNNEIKIVRGAGRGMGLGIGRCYGMGMGRCGFKRRMRSFQNFFRRGWFNI